MILVVDKIENRIKLSRLFKYFNVTRKRIEWIFYKVKICFTSNIKKNTSNI